MLSSLIVARSQSFGIAATRKFERNAAAMALLHLGSRGLAANKSCYKRSFPGPVMGAASLFTFAVTQRS
eukprot:6191597-Pleurochrysis_carterae.AAC.3